MGLAPSSSQPSLTTSDVPTNNGTEIPSPSSQSGSSPIFSFKCTHLANHTNSPTLSNATATESSEFEFAIFGTCLHAPWWLGTLPDIAMVVGCILPYVPQYITIHKLNNSSGFSTYVCLTLLIANIARIIWYFGETYRQALLVQAILMIITQILLLRLCIRVKRENAGNALKRRNLFRCNPITNFWRWTDLISYLVFLCLATGILSLLMFFFVNCAPFVQSLGLFAMVTESMLGLPQVIKNCRKRSVMGMSLSMVLLWLGGDMFKTVYFFINGQPFQFKLCGLTQITIDLLILFQVCLFRQNAPIKVNSDTSPKEMMTLS